MDKIDREVIEKRVRIVRRELTKVGIYGFRYMEDFARQQAQSMVTSLANEGSDDALVRFIASQGWSAKEIIEQSLQVRNAIAMFHMHAARNEGKLTAKGEKALRASNRPHRRTITDGD